MTKDANARIKTKSGWNVLHCALRNDHLDTVKLLVSCGEDVMEKTGSGKNAYHLAAKYGNVKILEYFESSETSGIVETNLSVLCKDGEECSLKNNSIGLYTF